MLYCEQELQTNQFIWSLGLVSHTCTDHDQHTEAEQIRYTRPSRSMGVSSLQPSQRRNKGVAPGCWGLSRNIQCPVSAAFAGSLPGDFTNFSLLQKTDSIPRSVPVAYYQAIFPGESPAKIAWIGSFQIFFLFFMSIIASPLIEKGYFQPYFNGGCLEMFFSILGTSWCHEFGKLLAVRGILIGIGLGVAFGSGVLIL